MREVVFVGHILSRGQRSPAPGKITALQNWPQPNTVTKMRGFLGLANHYSSYVPNYAHLAAPLMDMLKVGRADGKKGSQVKLKWTPERESAWITLRKAVTNDLVVFQLHPDSPFLLCTDASDYAIGAVLEQNRDGKPVPVGFFSRKLTDGQLNWSVREKETYAIVAALRKWSDWIGFQPVVISTDHRSLEHWVNEHVDTWSEGPESTLA
jgi:hypothetical protein